MGRSPNQARIDGPASCALDWPRVNFYCDLSYGLGRAAVCLLTGPLTHDAMGNLALPPASQFQNELQLCHSLFLAQAARDQESMAEG